LTMPAYGAQTGDIGIYLNISGPQASSPTGQAAKRFAAAAGDLAGAD